MNQMSARAVEMSHYIIPTSSVDRPVAIGFCGSRRSNRWGMTIGDVWSARHLHHWLANHHVKSVLLYEQDSIISTRPGFADPRFTRPTDFSAFVWACGPLTAINPIVSNSLFKRFGAIPRIAVNVSQVTKSGESHFDKVVWRDSASGANFDIAIDPRFLPKPVALPRRDKIVVCLVGNQKEYGRNSTNSRAVRDFILTGLNRLGYPAPTFADTHVEDIFADFDSVEHPFATARLVITNRVHGSLLCLRHRTPFVAIDQVRGGAKITRLIGDTLKWPFCYLFERMDTEDLARGIEGCERLSQEMLSEFRSTGETLSANAMDVYGHAILDFVGAGCAAQASL